MTNQDMLDQAMEDGATLLAIGKNEWVKVTDEGTWSHLTNAGETTITWDEAIALKDR